MKRRLFSRIFSAFLCLTMAICLCLSLPITSFAINATASAKNPQYHGDGSLKSVDITFQAGSGYRTAYGRFAIHNGSSAYYQYHPCAPANSVWPSSSFISQQDKTFIAFGEGDEFDWTDEQVHTVTISFAQGQIPADSSKNYSLVMWTRSDTWGFYPDFVVGTLQLDSNNTYFNGTEVTSNGTTPPSNELVPETAPVHTHHWVVTGDNTDTLTASCTGTVGTCDLQSVSVKLSASSVTLPDSPYNAVISGAEGFQSQTGLKIQPLADKGRAAYKFKAVGADHFTDPDLSKAEAGTYQAIVYVTDDDGVTHSAFVEYTAIDPVKTAATGDNRPIELMVLGLGMFCAMAAACFTLDRKHR